ncbi:Flp pilus assembly protein CpaB [Ammoniphilus resinae]|uniref:Pilus assembly protein CpaB n=1 Tax=Ammoniphilus resinae TaxID=861532 RepID=A0ABS4GKB2_9BACL|nr:SAF domain-containing protein [Ammoniphilus resinae]MBP1930691.1 pilus assembly protein CpaB [Ammoniphilus resinae]
MFESRKRVFIFTILSIAFAMAAAFLFSNYIKQTKQSLGNMVSIHVAEKDIPAGSPITSEFLSTIEMPIKYASESFIKSAEQYKDKISLVPIPKGEVLTVAMLRDISNVPTDHRMVQLRAPLAVFDDQINPLDRVDLFSSYETEADNNPKQPKDRRITELTLKNVEVLQVSKQDSKIISIGVALKPEQAKRIIWILNYGKELRVVKSNSSIEQGGKGEGQ